MKKIVALVGSLRRDSFNRQLALTFQERYKDKFELEIADISSLPFFNEDIEANPGPGVSAFRSKVQEADGVLIFTPEYNWSIPAVLKNALDWLSREGHQLEGKPVHIAGASGAAMGTIRAQIHLRQILSSAGVHANLLPPGGNEILVTFARQKFDGGRLKDESTLAFIDGVVEKFVQFVEANK